MAEPAWGNAAAGAVNGVADRDPGPCLWSRPGSKPGYTVYPISKHLTSLCLSFLLDKMELILILTSQHFLAQRRDPINVSCCDYSGNSGGDMLGQVREENLNHLLNRTLA